MKNNALIDDLSRNLQPVQPITGPVRTLRTTMLWFSGTLAFLFATVGALLHFRKSFFNPLLGTLLILVLLSSYISLISSIPGKRVPRAAKYLALFFLALAFETYACSSQMIAEGASFALGWKCSFTLTALGMIPGFILLLIIKKRAPVNPSMTARWIGLALASAGAMGLHLECDNPLALHLLLYHGLPIFILSALSGLVGLRLLRW